MYVNNIFIQLFFSLTPGEGRNPPYISPLRGNYFLQNLTPHILLTTANIYKHNINKTP